MKLVCIKDFSALSIHSKLVFFKSGKCYDSIEEFFCSTCLMVKDGVGNCCLFYVDDENNEHYMYNYFESLEINRNKKLNILKI
ncbi:MAG: hypothetical protein M0R46_06365 [Candidatus Muirbacterium halophilum]|nr:hypothetical protein [Candidatus Muirbacterium halophilum]